MKFKTKLEIGIIGMYMIISFGVLIIRFKYLLEIFNTLYLIAQLIYFIVGVYVLVPISLIYSIYSLDKERSERV